MRATVDVRVEQDGSGVVHVRIDADADAVATVEVGGASLETAVRLDDLIGAGWRVGSWERDDGSASIVLSKRFDTVEQVAGIFEEASGERGPVRDLRATRDGRFLDTDFTVTGRIDLTAVTTDLLADPELLANLSAQQVDANVIDQQLLADVKASFALEVVVHLPGTAADRTQAEPGAVAKISVTSSVRDTSRLILLGAAAVLGILAIVLWFLGGRRRRSRRGQRAAY